MSVELAEAALLNETSETNYVSKPEVEEQVTCNCGDKSACACNEAGECACEDADDEGEAPLPEADQTFEYVPEEPKLDILAAFRAELLSHVEKAQASHLEYFIAGLLMATHLPVLSWMFLAYVLSLPSVTVILHPEWLMANPRDNWMHQSLIIGVCVTSEVCAVRYLGNVFPQH